MSQKERRGANELHLIEPLQSKPVSDGAGGFVVVVLVVVVMVLVVFVEPDIATESQLDSLLDSFDAIES
jgi:hypothetical protein